MTEKEMIEIKHGSENMVDLLNQEQAELKKAMVDKEAKFSFIVIDNKTGKEADDYTIALKEDWARGLIYCDMEGFAILEDGTLLLLDECGNVAYCPSDRFSIIPEGAAVLTEGEYSDLLFDEVATLKRDIAEYWANADFENVVKELHKNGYRKLDDHAIFVLRKAKCLEEKVRKETAREFASFVKSKLFDLGNIVNESDVDDMLKEFFNEN